MKKNALFLLMLIITIVLAVMSWHYFGSDTAGILRGKQEGTRSWLPLVLRIHIGGGMIAMLTGAMLVYTSNRPTRTATHRITGRLYGLAVMISGLAGAIIAPHAIGGLVSALGLGSLSAAWMYFTLRSVQHALNGEWASHQRAAVYSLALTYSSLTFRLVLLFAFLGYPFVNVYRTSCWVSWLLHLGVVAWWMSREGRKRSVRAERQEVGGLSRTDPRRPTRSLTRT